MAIRWVAQAWKDVKEETIRKCFRSAGILDSSMDVVSCNIGEDDPFSDIDSDADFQGLIADIMPETERCNAQEYVNGDGDLSTCNDTENENLGQPTEEMQESETEADIQTESLAPPEAKITTFKDAIIALEDV